MGEGRLIANRFRLGDIIGQGGMGDVYRGVDTFTGQTVAIKALRPEIAHANPALVERFVREAEALRQLNHPNIVEVLASVEEDNRRYIVLEYVGGGSLADLLREQPRLPIRRIIEIGLDLADALTRAHRLKIVHRDIKPANVLLAEDGTPRLTDFGVAHLDDRSHITETGTMIGTYAYLSPEACYGQELDERADIWAFGIMLYEMLTGTRPFDEGRPAATLTAIISKPLPDLARLRPDAPAEMVNLVHAMLQKNPDERIGSVRLVGAELEALLRNLDTPSRAAAAPAEALYSRFATPTPANAVSGAAPPESPGEPSQATPARADTASRVADHSPIAIAHTEAGERFIIVRNRPLTWLIVGLAALLLIIVLVLPPGSRQPGEEAGADRATGTALQVEPVQPDEYLVLVGRLEALNVEARDVTRFVADDLHERLETEIPFSKIRVREYPAVITSGEEAQAAAQANGAAVVVWGNYNANFIQLEVQVGVLDAFPHTQFSQEMLSRSVNVRLRLTDALQESAAAAVLVVLSALQGADGDGYEFMRTIAVMDALDAPPAEIVSGGVAAHMHRFFNAFLEDTPTAIESINAAIALDAANPMLYVLRSIANQRIGRFGNGVRDAETAARLSPADWTVPLYLLANSASDTEAIQYYTHIIEQRPTDWFPVNFRGALYYLSGQYDLAGADLEQAIVLGPNANFPYVFAALLALREGRIADAAAQYHTILTRFPDPTLIMRLLEATFGRQEGNVLGPLLAASVNLALGQYAEVVAQTNTGLEMYARLTREMGASGRGRSPYAARMADLFVLQGLAQCNLSDPVAAEDAYGQAITLEPGFIFARFGRGEARLLQGDAAGAAADFDAVQRSRLNDAFAPLIAQAQAGARSCETLLAIADAGRE